MGLFDFLEKEDTENSYTKLLQLAEEGQAEAQYLIGDMYNYGTDEVQQSKSEAFKWFQKSADQGNNIGQVRLGYMYLAGEGATQNRFFAHALWLLSAKQGNEHALKNLEQLYKDFPEEDNDTMRITMLGNYEKVRQLTLEEPDRRWGDNQYLKERIDYRLVELQAECVPKLIKLFELSNRNNEEAKFQIQELYTDTTAKINGISIFFGQDLTDDQRGGIASQTLDNALMEVKDLLGEDKYKKFIDATGLNPVIETDSSTHDTSNSQLDDDSKKGVSFLAEETISFYNIYDGGESNGIFAMDISDDKKRLSVGKGYNGEISIIDIKSKNILDTINTTGIVNTIKFSNNDKYLAWGSSDDNTYIYDIFEKKLIDKRDLCHRGKGVNDIDISPNGKFIIAVNEDGLTLNHFLGNFISELFNYELYSVKFSPSNPNIALLGSRDDIYAFDMSDTFNQTQQLISANLSTKLSMEYYAGHENKSKVSSIVFSKSGEIFLSGDQKGTIILWNFKTKNIMMKYEKCSSPINHLSFSEDEKYFSSAHGNKQMMDPEDIKIWSIESNTAILSLKGHKSAVVFACFNEDNNVLSASTDGTIKLWTIT